MDVVVYMIHSKDSALLSSSLKLLNHSFLPKPWYREKNKITWNRQDSFHVFLFEREKNIMSRKGKKMWLPFLLNSFLDLEFTEVLADSFYYCVLSPSLGEDKLYGPRECRTLSSKSSYNRQQISTALPHASE